MQQASEQRRVVFRVAVELWPLLKTRPRALSSPATREFHRGFLFPEAGPSRHFRVDLRLQPDVAVQPVHDAAAGAGAVRPGLPGHAAGPEGERCRPLGAAAAEGA